MLASVTVKDHGSEIKDLQKGEFSFVTAGSDSAVEKWGSLLKMPRGRAGLGLGGARGRGLIVVGKPWY